MRTLESLHAALAPDSLREGTGFSEDLHSAQERILRATSDDERKHILAEWLSSHQPCLFGKIAARNDLIEYCFLTEADLSQGDSHVQEKITFAHTRWWEGTLQGRKSAFVLLATSSRLAAARPDAALLDFAVRLAMLYLNLEHVRPDHAYLDQAFLEIPGRPVTHLFRWDAGVNVFAACADRRWWQDHRIPGGLAFSVNSVGHLVKSAETARAVNQLSTDLHVLTPALEVEKVDSLGKALQLAMSTIDAASDAPSGHATWLLPAKEFDASDAPACPIELPKKLADKWHCSYRGAYHTDFTLPSLYFTAEVERPLDASALLLDFTYLFDSATNNPAYHTMGRGQQIRHTGESLASDAGEDPTAPTVRARRSFPTSVRVDDCNEIIRSLVRHGS